MSVLDPALAWDVRCIYLFMSEFFSRENFVHSGPPPSLHARGLANRDDRGWGRPLDAKPEFLTDERDIGYCSYVFIRRLL